MLDLDSLAETCAKSLNEREDSWRDAVWSGTFQQVAKNMSDGEVEGLLTSCPSLPHFQAVLAILAEPQYHSEPFLALQSLSQQAGLSFHDWIRTLI